MEKIRFAEALHVAGSIASIAGIGLLAIGKATSDLQLAAIVAYAMAASVFLGVLGVCVFIFRHVYSKLEVLIGRGVAVSASAVVIPFIMFGGFYFVLFLKIFVEDELIWLIGQMAK